MEITLPSGKVAQINIAPWVEAKRLKMAMERDARAGIDLRTVQFNLEASADALIHAFLSCDSSPEVDSHLMTCMARCTRDQQKIIETTFDTEESRQDYYAIAFACLKVNLGPLVTGLLSELSKVPFLTKQAVSQK